MEEVLESNQIFEYLDEVYRNKEKYNMLWALKDAQEKLNIYRKEVVDEKIKSKCKGCKKLNAEYKIYQSSSHSQIRKQRIITNIFGLSHQLISVLEILLSVILVMAISAISHGDFLAHGTRGFSVAVIIIFAFIKVFIEQLFLKPRVESLGWKLYKNSVQVLKQLTEQIHEDIEEREMILEAV